MAPFVVLEPEGLYADTSLEHTILSTSLSKLPFEVHQANLGEDLSYSTIPAELRQRVNGLFVFRHWVKADDVDLFENLKVIVRMGVGYDRLDRVALDRNGVVVCNCPDYGTTEVADHAIGLALSLRRGILLHHDAQRTLTSPEPALWEYIPSPLVQRPSVRTFGILGLGRIGTAVALRAKALGWSKVVFFDPYLPNGVDRALGIDRVRTKEELFECSDTLSLHVPLTGETRGIVGKDLLGRMKKGSILVNTSRGGVVDLDALEDALKSGKLAGAGLDVIPVEPAPRKPGQKEVENVHSLIQAYRKGEEWLKGRLVITPHVAFYSQESWDDIRRLSCETMRDVLLDGLKTNVIRIEDE
ncbi:hypothetical protein M408DRAFT_18289 [Serendipita vermifera MAFF 305830]|uniref:C-terminal binding protein n=1 Tax=Serendipita vermifera MAFF 305830 TaxID=933852 RepID=A0A0C2WX24_SERVB|nr:hypothetical protein M408DRAFT_18289 [Serendipita vermifera MAFF 305830]